MAPTNLVIVFFACFDNTYVAWGISPRVSYWGYNLSTLSSSSSNCNLLEVVVPVDEVYGHTIFRQEAVTRLGDKVPG